VAESAELTAGTGSDIESTVPVVDPVARHYSRHALLSTLLDALSAAGKSAAPIDSDDLSPVDELHTGGRAATVELADLLAPSPARTCWTRLCLGARRATGPPPRLPGDRGGPGQGARRGGRRAHRALRTGELATFRQGSVTALPFGDEGFDAAVLVHVG